MSKRKIHRAGVVPFYIDNGSILMMFMKPSNQEYGGEKYQLIKGKVEKGESNHEAAFREAEEESGLKSSNVNNFFKIGVFLGRTTVYAAEIHDPEDFEDHTDETESTKWMTLEQFLEEGRKLHKNVVRNVYEAIEERYL